MRLSERLLLPQSCAAWLGPLNVSCLPSFLVVKLPLLLLLLLPSTKLACLHKVLCPELCFERELLALFSGCQATAGTAALNKAGMLAHNALPVDCAELFALNFVALLLETTLMPTLHAASRRHAA